MALGWTQAGAASLALILAGCGGDNSQASDGAGASTDTAAAASRPETQPAAPLEDALLMPPSWMPSDWDRNVTYGAGEPGSDDSKNKRSARQRMLATVPFTLWAVANDTLVTEAFEPIWVWYTAIRSCDRGIQMSDDLAGEFGDRERGKAALTQARTELKTWAASQPRELTLYFTARLGQWNESTGAFPLQQPGRATSFKPKAIKAIDEFHDGATVQLRTSSTGENAIAYFQASLVAPQCPNRDKSRIYKFEKMSQWWVYFGDVDTGVAGQVDFKAPALLPPITMSREAAAAFSQRNSQREVEVAVTFVPAGSSFLKLSDQSAIRANYKRVTITDALNDTVLASKAY